MKMVLNFLEFMARYLIAAWFALALLAMFSLGEDDPRTDSVTAMFWVGAFLFGVSVFVLKKPKK